MIVLGRVPRLDVIEDLKRRKGPDADQPHRVQYRKLVRS